MEGVGSRLGRASSRYGPTTATVFNGPVRKWKKKWVHVSPPQPSTLTKHNSSSRLAHQQQSSSLFLCRWTPLPSSSSSTTDSAAATPEEPPKRKFRYTPIAVIEEQSKASIKKTDEETTWSDRNQNALGTNVDLAFGKNDVDKNLKKDNQEPGKRHFDLDLQPEGHGDNSDNIDEDADFQSQRAIQAGFRPTS